MELLRDVAPASDESPDGVLAVSADLTDPESAERVVEAASSGSAGCTRWPAWPAASRCPGPLHESSPDDWRGQLAVNLDTAYTMTRATLGPMLAAGAGSIVYVGSRAAVRPFAGAAPYIVSKAAVLALMGAVDAEVRSKGLRVNTVMASVVDTPAIAPIALTPTFPGGRPAISWRA